MDVRAKCVFPENLSQLGDLHPFNLHAELWPRSQSEDALSLSLSLAHSPPLSRSLYYSDHDSIAVCDGHAGKSNAHRDAIVLSPKPLQNELAGLQPHYDAGMVRARLSVQSRQSVLILYRGDCSLQNAALNNYQPINKEDCRSRPLGRERHESFQ